MTLSPGTKIGTYEIAGPLGAGGMGEVYRARDTRLERSVAIKVLPAAFANDAERMARFSREAQVLASLNHTNIASIHGFEDSDGVRALVMELVEGATLAERIALGAIPLEESLPIAKQLAEALEYAHDRGIIHRDLKPANLKVTPDGKLKVLDFGLAKALDDAPAAMDSSSSPTISMAATRAGIILGTAAYMSPEQARGKPVDRRSDLWSFGAVLFEMLSGKQAFAGEDASHTMASVIMKEPDFSALPANLPPSLVRMVRRCLTKDPKQRLQSSGEARIAIEEILNGSPEAVASPSPAPISQQPAGRRMLPWAGMGVMGLALAVVLILWAPWKTGVPPAQPQRLSVAIGVEASVATEWGAAALLTPDGTRLILNGNAPGQSPRLYVRPLEQLTATPLAGTEGARDAFLSPDSQWIGFFAQGKLKKVSVQGGAAVTLCDAPSDRGGSWGDDGTIVFAANNRVALSKVSSEGGTPEPLTTLDKTAGEVTHRYPQVLAGSKAILFTAHNTGSDFDDATIVAQSLETGKRKIILKGGMYARYLPSGHLIYVHRGTLFAATFDPKQLEITGKTVPVLESLSTSSSHGTAQFDFSLTGTFTYVLGGAGDENSIYLLDHDGKPQPLKPAPGRYYDPRFSPDGKRLALEIEASQGGSDVWIYDLQRDAMQRFTLAGSYNLNSVWTSDGQRIAFSSDRGEGKVQNIYVQRADGSGEAERLTESKHSQYPFSWRHDAKLLAFGELGETGPRIWMLPMEGDDHSGWKPGKPQLFSTGSWTEYSPGFSPDGRWVAYNSLESGRSEVFVRPYPGPGGKKQISTDGGFWPRWSPKGSELFYETPDHKIWSAKYSTTGESFNADKPRLWSDVVLTDTGTSYNYDLAPDGKHLVILSSPTGAKAPTVDHVNFITNFFNELRRVTPLDKK